jgi:tetratricopeptide (TPR) repeat protein
MNDVFDLPVGANAMAMGGAYVAMADDPFALYWNPAALEAVPRMSLGLYMNNLPTGAQYNYIAYAHPTLSLGTVSAGILRLSIDDIPIRGSQDAALLGTVNYGRMLFLLGYGIKIFEWMSVGTTMKVESSTFPGAVEPGALQPTQLSESAFGMDAGLQFMSQFSNFLLANTVVGINVHNTLQRTLQLVDEEEKTPRLIRIGISRRFLLDDGGSYFRMGMEVDENSAPSMPTLFHVGGEYSFRQLAFLRAGVSDGSLTYGAGLRVFGVQLDYSMSNKFDALLGNSHRLSVVLSVGKSRQERLAEAKRRELERIEREIQLQLQMAREEKINTAMSKARSFYNLEDYERAANEIYKVLAFDETGEDEEFTEARLLRDRIETALEEKRKEQERLARARDEAEAERRRREQKIRQHHQKALAYYQDEEYNAVIDECEDALAIDPDRRDIQDLKQKAETDLRQKINQLATQGIQLAQDGRTAEAINVFTRAKRLARDNREAESFIESKIRALEGSLNYDELVRRAMYNQQNKNWTAAADLYRRALEYDPNNQALKQRYEYANARANAREQKMTPEVLELYSKGSDAFVDGDYEQALRYYEQALDLQPYNRAILRGIDVVRERMQRQQAATEEQN